MPYFRDRYRPLFEVQSPAETPWYDTMQVCIDGHMITAMLRSSPEFGKDHCPDCGARTISKCETCGTEIQGYYHSPGIVGGSTPVPAHCEHCGQRFPWTQSQTATTAERDAVTKLLPRNGFDEDLAHLTAVHTQSHRPLSLIMMDLDDFKLINDSFSHLVGDEVLASAALAAQSVLEGKGNCYRFGGEEFAILLPNFTCVEAIPVAERIRAEIYAIVVEACTRRITASFGVATFPEPTLDASNLLQAADEALYTSKHTGKNYVSVSGTTASTPPPNWQCQTSC